MRKDDLKLVSSEYFASKKVIISCKEGHLRKCYFYSYKKGSGCNKCKNKTNPKRKNEGLVEKELASVGLFLENKYKNNRERLLLKCKCGYRFSSSYNNIFHNKNGCPVCEGRENTRELECRYILNKLTGEWFYKERPEWLVNPHTGRKLELDGYCKKLDIAFEYDTIDHFQKEAYTLEKKVKSPIAIRDEVKNKICKEKQIKLIRIPYYIEDLRSFIQEKIDE